MLIFLLLILAPFAALAEHPRELRGVWITNVDSDVLASKESIAEAMDFLADAGFNIVFPVVWNKAQTLYPSAEMQRRFGIPIDPVYGDRDPLAELIVEAHRNGMEVVPWFEFGFSSSYNEGGGHLLAKHPEWRALDKDGNLLKKNNFEWMNAFDPQVQDFLTGLLVEVAESYDVDGVQGDDRLPALPSEGGYDPATAQRFRMAHGQEPPADHQSDPWLQWRADILTDYLAHVRWRIRRIDPNLLISVSPSIYDWGLREYLQDLRTWTRAGLYDIAHPQAYRYNFDAYRSLIDEMVESQFSPEELQKLSPGVLVKVGSYRIDRDFMLQSIAYNRSRGINGEVHFFYEGLRLQDDELGRALKEGPYAAPARLPHRNGQVWRPGGLITPVDAMAASEGWDPYPGQPGFLIAQAGSDATLTASVSVPVAGTYDIYMNLPKGGGHASAAKLTFGANLSDDNTLSLAIDQSAPGAHGWVMLARAYIPEGETPDFMILSRPQSGEPKGQLVAGPVMLLLNRRHSPNVVWPD